MTVFAPLEASSPFPESPSFLRPSPDPRTQVEKVLRAMMKAKRVVVVCGAGISVHAGIPDFRSPDGLFQTMKRDNPREPLTSGKDLFDASVFNSENTTSLFCQMIAQLSVLSQAATPTPFHQLLRLLDSRGKLLRVYTQNIDSLEEKAGLSFGVPEFDERRSKPKSKGKGKAVDVGIPAPASFASQPRLSTPPVETPRCIPLHGTLQHLHCQTCMNHSFPLEDHITTLQSGIPPFCPECTALEETRQLIGKRARGVGRLRPSVVLYNEEHRDGEGVGEVARKDLLGSSKGKARSGADLLVVVGTSLRVPGTKRMVREFSKAVRSRGASSPLKEASTSHLPTPSPSPRRSPASDEEPPIKTIYLNYDFPVPTREWEGVFDVWVQGDAQKFAEMLHKENAKHERTKREAEERKEKKERQAAITAAVSLKMAGMSSKKRKAELEIEPLKRSTKKQKTSSGWPSTSVKPKSCITSRSTPTSPTKSKRAKKITITLKIPALPLSPPKTPSKAKASTKRRVPEVYITTLKEKGRKIVAHSSPVMPLTPPSSSKKARPTPLSPADAGIQDAHGGVETGKQETIDNHLVRTLQYGLRGSNR